jgi:hypothetical protein
LCDFGETDDWGHEGRYDLYLHAARNFDQFVRILWKLFRRCRNTETGPLSCWPQIMAGAQEKRPGKAMGAIYLNPRMSG